jgi:DNA-binding GntR family transcriptional regulator
LGRLRESCERFEKLSAKDDVLKLVEENLFFHDIILEAAESEALSRMLRNLVELPLVYTSYFLYSLEQKLISEHYHRQLVKAFESRDAARAELLMKEHIKEGGEFLVARLRSTPTSGYTETQIGG